MSYTLERCIYTGYAPHIAQHFSIYSGVRVVGNHIAIHMSHVAMNCALAVGPPTLFRYLINDIQFSMLHVGLHWD